MSSVTPFGRLTGPLRLYVAPSTEAIPDLDAAPAGNWVELGETDGDQTVDWVGSLTGFSDNDATGMRKHVRDTEGLTVTATLVNLTLEHRARVFSMTSGAVTTTTSGALAVKELAHRRGYCPTRYSLLLRGGVLNGEDDSPYGAWPGQRYVPLGVFDGEPSEVRSKGGSPGLEFIFTAEWDDTAAAGREFGYMQVQSS